MIRVDNWCMLYQLISVLVTCYIIFSFWIIKFMSICIPASADSAGGAGWSHFAEGVGSALQTCNPQAGVAHPFNRFDHSVHHTSVMTCGAKASGKGILCTHSRATALTTCIGDASVFNQQHCNDKCASLFAHLDLM